MYATARSPRSHSHQASSPFRSMLQKSYGIPKPVMGFRRFLKERFADTGYDPHGGFMEFMKHDIIRPLQRELPKPDKAILFPERWAINTEKHCSRFDNLPKLQQYKEYNFPLRSESDAEKYKSTFNTTDHISIRVPNIQKIEESKSFLNLKSKYGAHSETENGWAPQGNFKTMNNRNSVTYNILTNEENPISGAVVLKILDKKVTNKKKGVGEIADLSRVFQTNFNRQFHYLQRENPQIFHVYTGIFSHMYDAAHRNGNIVVPFRNNKRREDGYSRRAFLSVSPKSRAGKSPRRE